MTDARHVSDDRPEEGAAALRAALGQCERWPGTSSEAGVFAALADAMVLVPVVSTLVSDGVDPGTGLRVEREAELALVTVETRSGRALPVFTSVGALRRWRLEARPVRLPAPAVCRAVLDEGWHAVVVDPPRPGFAVSGAALSALAAGFLPVAGQEELATRVIADQPVLSAAELDPAEVAALRRALGTEPLVAAAYLVASVSDDEPGGVPVLALELKAPVDAAGLATIARRLLARTRDRLRAPLDVMLVGRGSRERVQARGRRIFP